jgi:hypothetical protein
MKEMMKAHEVIAKWVDMDDLEWTFITPSLQAMALRNFYINRIMKHPEVGTMLDDESVLVEEPLFHPAIAIMESEWAIAEFIDDLFNVINNIVLYEDMENVFDYTELYLR